MSMCIATEKRCCDPINQQKQSIYEPINANKTIGDMTTIMTRNWSFPS